MAELPWATFHSSSPYDTAQSRTAINSRLIGTSFLVKRSDFHMALDQWFSTLATHWHNLRSWKHTGAWVPPTRRVWFNWFGVWPGHPDTYKLPDLIPRRSRIEGLPETRLSNQGWENTCAAPRTPLGMPTALYSAVYQFVKAHCCYCPELAFSKLPSITNYFHCSNQSHTKYYFVLNTLNDQLYYSLLFLSLVLTSLSCGHHWYFGQFHRISG